MSEKKLTRWRVDDPRTATQTEFNVVDSDGRIAATHLGGGRLLVACSLSEYFARMLAAFMNHAASASDALLAERDAEIARLRNSIELLENETNERSKALSKKFAEVKSLTSQLTAHREAVRVLVNDILGRDMSLHRLTGQGDYRDVTVNQIPGATANPAVAAIIDTALRSAGEEGGA